MMFYNEEPVHNRPLSTVEKKAAFEETKKYLTA